ncbi:MAG: hypothetical protein KDK36_07415 [Leptospiraceae bacterium]|nr:hypothetical protein [Leptospiraceae bacterium]
MAEIKVYYEPDMNLLTIFWDTPISDQICSEMDDGVILIKNSKTGSPIGIEILSFKPEDKRIGGISLLMGNETKAA